MPIPWDKVILHGPQVLDAAKNLYGKWQSRPKQAEPDPNDGFQGQFDKLLLRVRALEEEGEKQAALAAQLAEQNQALTAGLSEFRARNEQLRLTLEAAGNKHAEAQTRLDELAARFRQSNDHIPAMQKRLNLAISIAYGSLVLSVIALAVALLR